MFPTVGVKESKQNQDAYFASFTELEKRARAGPEWVHRIRKEALEQFGELGFPNTHQEDWKYTNVAPLTKIPFELAGPEAARLSAKQLERAPFTGFGRNRLVFVNGRFSRELSHTDALPQGVKAGSLGEALASGGVLEEHLARHASFQNHAFVALNTAFIEDGAFVWIPKGVVLEEPIHLLFVSTPNGRPLGPFQLDKAANHHDLNREGIVGTALVSHPRNLIVAERESQASIIESYVGLGDGAYFTNAVTELVAGESAVVEHYKLQQESERAFHIATLRVNQARSASVVDHSVALGSLLARNDVNAVLDGEGGECILNGLYHTTGTQHVDNHTVMDHAKPHCGSREFYKGILDGHSSGVFNGGIVVRKDAQKTDAKQSNKNLLLSADAVINTKPQLEIYADDVKCTHGATIGQIDQDAIFYLRTRGIDLKDARDLLTYAFTNDVLARMKVEAVRKQVEAALFARLAQKQATGETDR